MALRNLNHPNIIKLIDYEENSIIEYDKSSSINR